MKAFWQYSAHEIASGVSAGKFTAVEVLNAHLERIEVVNPALNAVVLVTHKEALAAAKAVDAAVAAGKPVGPLAGVPVTIKENIDWVASATTQGMPALAEAVPAENAPIIDRILAAGAVPIGRSNLPEMGLRLHTDNALHGPTVNPWDATRTTGGSSGGEGAALASGMSALGLGNDIGGSLRNPASCCGIASIKPTQGLIPFAVTIPSDARPITFQLMNTDGPMARRVADVRVGFEVMRGWHPRDPVSMSAELTQVNRPLRIGVMAEPPGGDTDASVAAIVRKAAAVLADAGCVVEQAEPEAFEDTVDFWGSFLSNDISQLLPLLEPMLSADSMTFLNDFLVDREQVTVESYAGALTERMEHARRWSVFFNDYDLLLSPVWTRLPYKVGWDIAAPGRTEDTMRQARCVLPGNVLGLPSAAVPGGVVEGVPVGVMLTGARFSDYLCLDAAEMIEAVLGLDTPIDAR